MKVKTDKCKWFENEVEYLGHIVGTKGMRKVPRYVEKVKEFQVPKTVGQLREFLGLANFQRKFVPNFSTIQKPLSEKTGGRRSKVVQWTEEMERAFLALKERISEDVRLSFPDYGEDASPLELYVDASGVGAGACLAQRQADGDVHIIAYASTTFSAAERHHSTIERELTALRWGVKAMRPFLVGTEFVIHTDHQPLIYLSNMKIIDSRLARTLEDLADFSFTIQYTPGKLNTAADALSHLYEPGSIHYDGDALQPGRLPAGLAVLKEVPGGGDSLFQSLYLLGTRVEFRGPAWDSAGRLREVLVDDLLNRPDLYKISLTRNKRKQLKLMRLEGQLPCVEVLYAFGELFGCYISVHFGRVRPVNFVPPCRNRLDKDCQRILLQCLGSITTQ